MTIEDLKMSRKIIESMDENQLSIFNDITNESSKKIDELIGKVATRYDMSRNLAKDWVYFTLKQLYQSEGAR